MCCLISIVTEYECLRKLPRQSFAPGKCELFPGQTSMKRQAHPPKRRKPIAYSGAWSLTLSAPSVLFVCLSPPIQCDRMLNGAEHLLRALAQFARGFLHLFSQIAPRFPRFGCGPLG